GVGMNVARALAQLKHRVRLVTRIGRDDDADMIMAGARIAGLDVSTISVSATAPTASYHAAFDHRGSLVIGIADMTIFDEIVPAAVATATMKPAQRSLWVVDANLPDATLNFVIGEATSACVPVVALTVSPAKAVRLAPHLDKITLLVANRREAAVL